MLTMHNDNVVSWAKRRVRVSTLRRRLSAYVVTVYPFTKKTEK